MNKIEEMLQELCPNGVEWKTLGEVCVIQRGERITKKQLLPKGYPVVSGGTGYMGYTDNYNRESETITIAQYGTAGYVKMQKEKFWANDVCFSVYPKEILLNKYLYYVLTNNQEYLYSISNRIAVPYSISKEQILKIKIPIPPLEIQEEIVQILDKFTKYVTELTAELTKRQKQYSFYRDKLLSFEDAVYQVEWKTLGEVADVRDGTHDTPKRTSFGRYLVTSKNVKNGTITFDNAYFISESDYDEINKRSKVDIDDLLFTMIGTIGEIAHITIQPDYAIKNVGLIKTNNRTLSRFLFHYLKSTHGRKYIENNKSKGSQVFFALGKLRNFPVPIPSLAIQSRIVQVLDNFDEVCHDLNIGLPKEIELRQKQYEYFRDKLLTFTAEGVYTNSTVQCRAH